MVLKWKKKKKTPNQTKPKPNNLTENLWSHALNDVKHDLLVDRYQWIWHGVLFVPQRTENINRMSDPTL